MPPLRPLAALLIGSWLAGSVFMDATAVNSFHAVDRFLADPDAGAAVLIKDPDRPKARVLLRRVAGESNAGLFESWGWIQMGLSLALLCALAGMEKPARLSIACGVAMLAIVLATQFALTPNIARLARVIDFLPADPSLPVRKTFGMYHGISSSLELLKLALGFTIAGVTLLQRPIENKLQNG